MIDPSVNVIVPTVSEYIPRANTEPDPLIVTPPELIASSIP